MTGPPGRALPLLVLAGLVALANRPAAQLGLGCSIGATPLTFGSYSVFSGSALDSSGTVTVQCALGVLVRVGLGRGTAPNFTPRTLRTAGQTLNYNIFTNAARSQIWGDGTGGTSTQTIVLAALTPHVWQTYGRVPAGQDVAAGAYLDTVTASFIF